jgi:hypothetical protein
MRQRAPGARMPRRHDASVAHPDAARPEGQLVKSGSLRVNFARPDGRFFGQIWRFAGVDARGISLEEETVASARVDPTGLAAAGV